MSAGASILIVDDEEPNRALLRAILGGQHKILEAADGPSALRVLAEQPVDLVLLDVMMPGMTGYDVCRSLKQSQSGPFLPVLLVTALSDQEQKNLGLQAGADDFLSKPVDRRELILRVRAFLRLRAQDALIRQQLKQLAQLQQTKDDMLSLMVHDMRSPLAGIIAHLHLLLEDVPEGRARDDVKAALRGADSMLSSLEEALQIRLLEEGHFPIGRSRVDLKALIADAAATLEPTARRKRIVLSTKVVGHSFAFIDGKLVRRALENLLGNALKYTPGDRDVSVAVRHEDGSVEIEVADRGPGIPGDLKATMFQKYGSVEAKKGGPRKGFGFGLYMVRLVAEGHQGMAEVIDREGGGAVFRLRLQDGVDGPQQPAAPGAKGPRSGN
jgi:two-component system, sensor histidine kinase and response regulator